MDIPPETAEKIQVVETHLSTLDSILCSFCARYGYSFRKVAGIWPRRRLWRREGVDQYFDLTMDLTVPELMERGFSPEMPWSLYISASTRPRDSDSVRILTEAVFRRLPFSSIPSRLTGDLALGLARLQTFTPDLINERGRLH
jgi:hypothetical protein